MIFALAGWVLAAPPEGIDPDDLDRWEGLSNAALNGPSGCWNLGGTVHVETSFLARASFFSRTSETPYVLDGTWSGRLQDGLWTAFRYRLEYEGEPQEVALWPVIGKIKPGIVVAEGVESEDKPHGSVRRKNRDEPDEEQDPVSVLRGAIDHWEGRTGTSVAQWDDAAGAIELIMDSPIRDNGPSITQTTVIPEGQWVSRYSARFPRRLKVGTWPLRATLNDTQFHLVQRRVRGHAFPAAENLSTVGSALGFTLSYEQRLDYLTASPCN